jgi:hypothetical protein
MRHTIIVEGDFVDRHKCAYLAKRDALERDNLLLLASYTNGVDLRMLIVDLGMSQCAGCLGWTFLLNLIRSVHTVARPQVILFEINPWSSDSSSIQT